MRGIARPHLAAVAVLALALIAGQAGRTVVDVSDLPLTSVPEALGPWTCIEQEMPEEKNTGEAAYLKRTYRHEDGTEILTSLQVTSSRLGALRNWSVAMMGNGWNVDEPTRMRPREVEGLPFEMTAKLQWLHRPGRRMFTATWFVSPRGQALEYEKAQMLGWRDKLLGKCIWGEMYLRSTSADSADSAEKATEDLVVRLAPHFYNLLTRADTKTLAGTGGA